MNRLHALTDGVYAIAMTLLVLELHVPDARSSSELVAGLATLGPSLFSFALSFAVLGTYWVGNAVNLSHLARVDRAGVRYKAGPPTWCWASNTSTLVGGLSVTRGLWRLQLAVEDRHDLRDRRDRGSLASEIAPSEGDGGGTLVPGEPDLIGSEAALRSNDQGEGRRCRR